MSSHAAIFDVIDVERHAIGCILMDHGKIKKCIGYDPRIFLNSKHKKIFEIMKKMYHSGIPIDLITIVNELDQGGHLPEAGGAAYIASLTDDIPTTANFSHYFNIIVEAAKKRATKAATENYGDDFKALKKQLSKIDRLYKKMKSEADELELEEEESQPDLTGSIDAELLIYNNPLEFAQRMKSTAADERDMWHEFFYWNLDIVPQACAALYFYDIYDQNGEPKLKKSDKTIWQYMGKPLHYWRPVADLTKPTSPYEPLSFLMGEESFILIFGQDFYIQNSEGKTKTKHYCRGQSGKIAMHFFTYCDVFLPQNRQFFMQRPMAAIPCQNGLFLLEEKKLIAHSPNHNQTIPAFPYIYKESEVLNKKHKHTISQYLRNLAPIGEMDIFAKYLGFRIGYTLTPWRMKKFFVDIGPGDTGKTKFLENIGRLHRETNTLRHTDFYKMAQKPGEFDNAIFEEALVVFNDDFPPAAKLPAQILKTIANKNTTIQINQKYKPSYSRINTATIMLSTNSEPKSPDSYISNRLLCTPFDNIFEDCAANDLLMEQMENSEIEETLFNYGIHCMCDFFSIKHLEEMLPKSVKRKTEEVIQSLNDTVEWLRESIDSGAFVTAHDLRIKKTALYDVYYKSRGSRSVGRNTFYMEVKKIYPERISGGTAYFEGIGQGYAEDNVEY